MSEYSINMKEIIKQINLLSRKEQDQLLELLFRQRQQYQTINLIKKTVCVYLQIPLKHVFSKTRKEKVVFARHLILYFLFKHSELKLSLGQIAAIVNIKTHADVIHACKKIEKILFIKNKYTGSVIAITQRLNFTLEEAMYFTTDEKIVKSRSDY